MKTELDRRAVLLALAALGTGAPSLADDDDDRRQRRRGSRHDHERARRARAARLARTPPDILAEVRSRLGGEVIDGEFEREDGAYVYELKVITPAGQLREIEVDALTAEILKDEAD